MPTSMFVCDTGGMVVICAGTTGYNATVDLRYLWMRISGLGHRSRSWIRKASNAAL
jgi:hypothetical protein